MAGNQLGQWGLWPRARRLSWQHSGGKEGGGGKDGDSDGHNSGDEGDNAAGQA